MFINVLLLFHYTSEQFVRLILAVYNKANSINEEKEWEVEENCIRKGIIHDLSYKCHGY
jgi:predicted hydrolase (HD superfamily)